MSPNSPSINNFINNLVSTTFETKNIPNNQKFSNNINDMISMVPYIRIISCNENFQNVINKDNNNKISNNYFVKPSKENKIQVSSYPFNNINTVSPTNKYIQINSSSHNSNNVNSNLTSSDKLISNYSFKNTISPIDKNNNYGNENISFKNINNNNKQYNGSNQELMPLNNNINNLYYPKIRNFSYCANI